MSPSGGSVPLRLGPLAADGFVFRRSGIHWLRPDGHLCRPSEVVAFCNLALDPAGLRRLGARPFAGERTLQVAFAPRIGGRLRLFTEDSTGGILDQLTPHKWNPAEEIARIEPMGDTDTGDIENICNLRLLMLAGRRLSWAAAEVDMGLLPGWNSHARAWWGDARSPGATLLSLGFCDATGVVRGDSSGFVEMFEGAPFAAQLVHVYEHPNTPCAPILIEQFLRSPAEIEAISADLLRGLGQGPVAPTALDWIYAGALMAQLAHSPMRETYDVLTPDGLMKGRPADAVLLSLGAESRSLLKHRTLGYSLNILEHDLLPAGPAIRKWLASAFEVTPRSFDDIRQDLIRLIDTVSPVTGARFLLLNKRSTVGREDVASYVPFDAPMRDTLGTIAAKELNLMLHDLAEHRDVFIVDADAAAAELGGATQIPDGLHYSREMRAMLRSEVLAFLAAL